MANSQEQASDVFIGQNKIQQLGKESGVVGTEIYLSTKEGSQSTNPTAHPHHGTAFAI
jgi:hypothetical protein